MSSSFNLPGDSCVWSGCNVFIEMYSGTFLKSSQVLHIQIDEAVKYYPTEVNVDFVLLHFCCSLFVDLQLRIFGTR